jgi:hypothetical protein
LASATTQSICVFKDIAYVALRLTFGGSPNPPTWCLFSKMVMDLANEIYMCKEWDPAQVRSPGQPVTPTPKQDDEPFGKALPTAIKVPTSLTAKTDEFIDDLITVFRDTPENWERALHTVPLAMHVTSRPHAGQNEPITLRKILADHKLIAKGSPAETQKILGWILKTRRLLISLPNDKLDTWKEELQKMITSKRTTFGELKTTVGRLNHVAYVIPLARHFLNRLLAKIRTPGHKHQSIRIATEEVQDLTLWTHFLTKAHKGISLNQITIPVPSRLTISDACPFGVGGYSLRGPAWRFAIPKSSPLHGDSRFNNLLEFLGMVVRIWLEIREAKAQSSECILALGNNTSAIGWLFGSGKVDGDPLSNAAIQQVARHLATLILESENCLASQHLKGKKNIVADMLLYTGSTRGHDHPLAPDEPSDEVLTHRLHIFLPS